MVAVPVQQAVYAAQQYLGDLQSFMKVPLESLRLEEVELSEDKGTWLVTLSYDSPDVSMQRSNLVTLGEVMRPQKLLRDYKIIKVNAETGEVEAMKIRTV